MGETFIVWAARPFFRVFHIFRGSHSRPAGSRHVFGVALCLALGVYLLTLATDLTWVNASEDGGELITAAVTLGVPHPPGYPTYVLLGHVWHWLPLGNVALRFNLFSAMATALAVGLVAAVHRAQSAGATGAIAGALTLAWTPLIWGQAVVAEVYGLNLALLALLLWGVQRGWRSSALGLVWGLSLTTHLTSCLMAPLLLAQTPWRRWGQLALGCLIGLTPYAVLPLLAGGDSPVVWGDPTTLAGWWELVTARLYHTNIGGAPAGAWPSRLVYLAQHSWPVVVWVGVCLVGAGRRNYPGRPLAACVTLYLGYSLSYDAPDAFVAWLPGLLLLSIGLTPPTWRLNTLILLLPVTALALNLASQNQRQTAVVRDLSRPLMAQLPPQALALTPGDQSVFTLWYLQHVEGQRHDIVLVDRNLFAFNWYRQRLSRFYPDLQALDKDDLDAFRQANLPHRPVCEVTLATVSWRCIGRLP